MFLKMHVVTGESVPSAAYRFSSASTPTFPQPLHPPFLSLYTHPQLLPPSFPQPLHPPFLSLYTYPWNRFTRPQSLHVHPASASMPIFSLYIQPHPSSASAIHQQPLTRLHTPSLYHIRYVFFPLVTFFVYSGNIVFASIFRAYFHAYFRSYIPRKKHPYVIFVVY